MPPIPYMSMSLSSVLEVTGVAIGTLAKVHSETQECYFTHLDG